MTSQTVTSPVPETGGSGARPPTFLRPLPGERRDVNRGQGSSHHYGDVLERLFPAAGTTESVEPESSAAVAGVRLGHFVIEERIGRGGMGAVFRAVDERLNRIVALKVLAPAYSRDPAAVERFRNEAQAAARLDHENIARVHYIGEDQGVPFIAFEFVRGTNVRDFILQKGMLSPAEAVNYALQIAQALRHTHAARVVHRDIKPSNIIITPSGHAKLVDLGLARQEHTEPAQELTVPGTTLGTFDYIAPEQARDPRCVDVRSDIYSLGCTLYHMLTGEPPFPQGTIIQKVVDHHRDEPPDPAVRNPQVPAELSRIVQRMMATNPDERHPSPEFLIYDLAQVAAALGLRPTHPDNLVWVRPLYEPRSAFLEHNKGWLVTLAALLLIAAAIHRMPSDWLTTSDEFAGRTSHAASENRTSAIGAKTTPMPDAESDQGAPPAPAPRRPSGMTRGLAGWNESQRGWLADSLFGTVNPDRSLAGHSGELGGSPPAPGLGSDNDLALHALERDIESVVSPVPRELAPQAGRQGASPAVSSMPFVVLDEVQRTEVAFATLEAACQQAPTDGVIELRFDGRLPQPQPPIKIQNKRLTVRAQEGKRPIIEFEPTSVFEQNDITQMVQIVGGQLKLYDVDLVMPVRAVAYEHWSLFSLNQAEELELRGVSIVVTNPTGQPASVIALSSPQSIEAQPVMPDSMMRKQVAINLQDCLIRAECDLVFSATLEPAEMQLDNVALALRRTLLRVHGRESPEDRVSDDRRLSIHLRHVTALLGEGMLRVDTGYSREFAPMEFQCEDSIVVVRSKQPLLSMVAHQDMSVLQRRLGWRSSWSAIDVTGPVWEIVHAFDTRTEELGFSALGVMNQQIIDNDLLAEPIRWNEVDLTTLTEREFALKTTGDSSTRNGSTGVQFGARVPQARLIATPVKPRSPEPNP